MVFAAAILTFALAGSQASQALQTDYYDNAGHWRACNAASCHVERGDWGADAATGVIFLRWKQTHAPGLSALAESLIDRAPAAPTPCTHVPCSAWSDTSAWDAVAAMREFEITGDARALAQAQADDAFIDRSTALAGGACTGIPLQHSGSTVKTLETTANQIKAKLLMYRATGERRYLEEATHLYAAARMVFFEPQMQLYTVHATDDGARCTAVPEHYFASVNGLMIWNGVELAADLNSSNYRDDALATAHAVDAQLSDGAGVFADTGGANDVAAPLVEAMLQLADDGEGFARDWIERNARAAIGARAPDGSFSRFFDGPPQAQSSIWESTGGFAVEVAAASLDPQGQASADDAWHADTPVARTIDALPATITVTGSAIALSGAVNGACMTHHVHVFIDGQEIPNHAGLWNNPSMPPSSIFFAWRWSTPGTHTITLREDDDDPVAANLVEYGI